MCLLLRQFPFVHIFRCWYVQRFSFLIKQGSLTESPNTLKRRQIKITKGSGVKRWNPKGFETGICHQGELLIDYIKKKALQQQFVNPLIFFFKAKLL